MYFLREIFLKKHTEFVFSIGDQFFSLEAILLDVAFTKFYINLFNITIYYYCP